jgi:hypothetical protein
MQLDTCSPSGGVVVEISKSATNVCDVPLKVKVHVSTSGVFNATGDGATLQCRFWIPCVSALAVRAVPIEKNANAVTARTAAMATVPRATTRRLVMVVFLSSLRRAMYTNPLPTSPMLVPAGNLVNVRT